jgi:hypothetical protein
MEQLIPYGRQRRIIGSATPQMTADQISQRGYSEGGRPRGSRRVMSNSLINPETGKLYENFRDVARTIEGMPSKDKDYFYDFLPAGVVSGRKYTTGIGPKYAENYTQKNRLKAGSNPREGIIKPLTYRTKRGTKYFLFNTEDNKLYETSNSEFRRFNKLMKQKNTRINPIAERKSKWSVEERGYVEYQGFRDVRGLGKSGAILDFDVRPATTTDLEMLTDKIATIIRQKEKKSKPLTTKQRSRQIAGLNPPLPPRRRGRKNEMPKRTARPQQSKERDFSVNVLGRTKEGEVVADSEGLMERGGVFTTATPFRPTIFDRGARSSRLGDVEGSMFYERGLRDRRTEGGNLLRSSRTRMGFKTRYQSAIDSAIIDRRIRNTEAENKLESEIKKVKESQKARIDNLTLLRDTAVANENTLKLKNQRLLHDHNVIVRGNHNATLLGSDAAEINKLITSGRLSYMSVKDMVRKGEITDIATLHQLDFPTGRDTKIKKLVSLLEDTGNYQVNKSYPFREVLDDGSVSILSGLYQKGGERGNNLQLLMPDGSRKIVRKRDILDPNDPRLGSGAAARPFASLGVAAAAPSVAYSSGDIADIASVGGASPATENPSVALWLGEAASATSSDSGNIFEEEVVETPRPEPDPPDVAIAQYNQIITTMPQRETFNNARKNELRGMGDEPEESSGFLGFGSNIKTLKAFRERKAYLERTIAEEDARIKREKISANKIASEKNFAIPFIEGGDDIIPARDLLRGIEEGGGEEEEEEFEPEPEPQVSSFSGGETTLEEVSLEDMGAESEIEDAKQRFKRDLESEGDLFKVNYKGYPLLVDLRRELVRDPSGKLPNFGLNPFASPEGNFIRFDSEDERIKIEEEMGKILNPPSSLAEDETPDEKEIGWVREDVKPSQLKKFATQNRPNSEAMMIWSTKYPEDKTTPRKGLYLTRDQLVARLDTLELGAREKANFIAKFDSEKGKGKAEFATNNKNLVRGLGLEAAPSTATLIDFRSSALQLD